MFASFSIKTDFKYVNDCFFLQTGLVHPGSLQEQMVSFSLGIGVGAISLKPTIPLGPGEPGAPGIPGGP